MRFIFLTKTEWSEPPRIRHQLARLLSISGYNVIFFERPIPFFKRIPRRHKIENNIVFLRHKELLHHKLRLNYVLYMANAFIVRTSIKWSLKQYNVSGSDVIVNFNYEYGFLRDIFHNNTIVTMINDDFWSRSPFLLRRPLINALTKTCSISDRLLTVSYPLQDELSLLGYQPILFFPWSSHPYEPTILSNNRNVLLFWGYINSKIDIDVVYRASVELVSSLPDVVINFVGPIDKSGENVVECLRALPNVSFSSPQQLDELDTNQCIASFIPYRSNVKSIDAITLPNKALQLLSKGLPLLITGMPYFIDMPFVYRFSPGDIVYKTNKIINEFEVNQSVIKGFVDSNLGTHRLSDFLKICKFK
jgi:hypothetical protein